MKKLMKAIKNNKIVVVTDANMAFIKSLLADYEFYNNEIDQLLEQGDILLKDIEICKKHRKDIIKKLKAIERGILKNEKV